MTRQKVLLIGLDAACFERIDPLLAAGSLPNLKRLLDSGVGAVLETTPPPWTPSAWPSIVTGSTPWTHGVYDFHHYADGSGSREADDPELVSARHVRVPFLWEVLSACGRSSIVINVPVTHPVHAFEGSLVPGCLAPEGTACLVDGDPRSMGGIDEDYRIYDRGFESRADRIADYEELIGSRVRAAERFAGTHDWSFMMVQFQHTDAVFHTDGEDRKAVSRVYERVDDAIGSLLSLAGDDCVTLVVSDHGMHRYEGVFYCNAWLRDRGYVETATDATRHAWNERTFRTAVAGGTAGAEGETEGVDEGEEGKDDSAGWSANRALSAVLDGLGRLGLTVGRAERALSTVGLDERVGKLLPEEVLLDIVDATPYVDRSRSAAYCRSPSSLGIRCNVADRDPEGVVPAAEFASFRATLVDDLRELRGPEGRPVFESVYDRHAVHGDEVANERSAPDIVLRPAGMAWKVSDIVRERTFGETEEFNHKYEGLFIAAGPGIDSLSTATPSVVDVAPTVLDLLGIEPPGTMDGTALFDLPAETDSVSPTVPERRFVDTEGTSGDTEAVTDHLRAMGYIE